MGELEVELGHSKARAHESARCLTKMLPRPFDHERTASSLGGVFTWVRRREAVIISVPRGR